MKKGGRKGGKEGGRGEKGKLTSERKRDDVSGNCHLSLKSC